ncbi:MAG: hypothetical protein CMK37_07860 [Porticoccaceae bacterium]|nr:hypothetical protein [Porticoccaceae bacterium]|tara:strand:+ start:3301 stop:3687 length:387 start_codon:yes stop_codon:yes gene_type:complete
MLIAYRPELENPPREAGFGIITDKGLISLTPGLNQEIPEDQWEMAKSNPTVQALLNIGAIEEMKERVEVETIPHSIESLQQLPLTQAMQAIELLHDEDKLNGWKKVEGRVRVRNAIGRRLEAIRTGKA